MTDTKNATAPAHAESETPQKVAVVTGATGGMGREIIADLAGDYHVYAPVSYTHLTLPTICSV